MSREKVMKYDEDKEFKSIAETYRVFTFVMTLGLMFPNPATDTRRFILLGIISSTIIPAYVLWFYDVYGCLQIMDIDNITRQLSVGVPVMFCQFKMISVNVLRKQMKEIFDEIDSDYEHYNSDNEEIKLEVRNNRQSLLRFEKIWTCVVLSTCFAFPLKAAVFMIISQFGEPQRYLIHDMDVPVLKEGRFDTPYFESLFAYEFYIVIILILCYLSYDGMFFLCLFHCRLRFKIIGSKLQHIFDEKCSISDLKNKIAALVEEQCGIYRFLDMIKKEYEMWLVLVFILSVNQICVDLYQVVTMAESRFDIQYTIFLFAAVLHIYVPCYLVSMMSAAAAEVSIQAYSSLWESVSDAGVRRSLAFIIARAQIPVNLQALNMITFNMELFVSVMQTSYSVLTLLRS